MKPRKATKERAVLDWLADESSWLLWEVLRILRLKQPKPKNKE